MWNLVLVYLEKVLVLVQDRCTVCAKHSIGSKILLEGDGAQVEARFGLLGDIANPDAREVHGLQ
jgi:hypothetical protein